MKDPELLQTIVIHYCLPYEIFFQVIQKKKKIDHRPHPYQQWRKNVVKCCFFILKVIKKLINVKVS